MHTRWLALVPYLALALARPAAQLPLVGPSSSSSAATTSSLLAPPPRGHTRLRLPPVELYHHQATGPRAPLENLQVHHPPLLSNRARRCAVSLLEHSFAFSYYEPAVVAFEPPTDCGPPGSWSSIVLNLTVTSNGTQFDRLASISLGHVEIWRTSTAEPTRGGIIWTYEKDVTRFSSLFAKAGQLMFQLDNVITDKYTGIFATYLTATFYESTPDESPASTADLILPLTTRSNTSSQMLVCPGRASVKTVMPINAAQAWLEVIATGAADEEFWYSNILDRWIDYFPEAGLIGKGPLREVQVLIDGQLAGFVYPFPVIYTGGANPLLWRPLASLRAFDVPSAFIDVSPFLPLLSDGKPHEFSFSVLGQGDEGSVNDHWFITGALHLVLDPSDPPIRTTGRLLSYDVAPAPLILSAGFPSPDGASLRTVVSAQRTLEIQAKLVTGEGTKVVHVAHEVDFDNEQRYDDTGTFQSVLQSTSSLYTSTHDGHLLLRDVSSFPLSLSTNYTLLASAHRFSADVHAYGYDRALSIPPALGGVEGKAYVTKSGQRGRAEILGREGERSTGWGTMEERYTFVGERGETYEERARAENATIVERSRKGSLSVTTTEGAAPSSSLVPPAPTTTDTAATSGPAAAASTASATVTDPSPASTEPAAAMSLDPPAQQPSSASSLAPPPTTTAPEERVSSLKATEGDIVDVHMGDGPLNPDEPTFAPAAASADRALVASASPAAAFHAPAEASTSTAVASTSTSPLDAAPYKVEGDGELDQDKVLSAVRNAASELTPLASPVLREATPSEAASDTTSTAGPAVAAADVPPEPSSARSELAHPLSAYTFANTTLVPADSTTIQPFFFANFPTVELAVSWARSKRGDDPEADIPPDNEPGYFATSAELVESRKREAARVAKVRRRLAEMGLAPDGSVIPLPAESAQQTGRGKGRGRGRAAKGARASGSRSREASSGIDGAAAAPASGGRRGRAPKASALREVHGQDGDELDDDDYEVQAPRSHKAKPRKASPPAPARLKVELATTLLQDDLQTSTPSFLDPHPAFIDELDLPPHYLPDGADLDDLPAVTGPSPAVARRLAVEASAEKVRVEEALAAEARAAAEAAAKAAPAAAPAGQEPAAADDYFIENEFGGGGEEENDNGEEEMRGVEVDGTPAGAAASDSASAARASETPGLGDAYSENETSALGSRSSSVAASRRTASTAVGAANPAKRARQPEEDDGAKAAKKKKGGRESTVVSDVAADEVPLGPPVEYVLQSTTCLSKKVDGQIRCWQCIARSIGHGCSFMGIRSFGVDHLGRIVTGPVFRSAVEADDVPNLDKPYTSPMTKTQSTLLKTWLAKDLVKLFEREWRHATNPNTIKVRNDLVTHSTCDTCNTACVGAEFICQTCGRTACSICYDRLATYDAIESSGGTVPTTADNQRRRKCIAKKRGKDQSGGESHRPAQFMSVTRLDASKLERMRQVARSWHSAHKLQASDPKVVQYIMEKFCVKSNLKEYDADTHRVWQIAHKTFDEPFFFEVWRRGEPILVRRCPPAGLAKYTPSYFASTWGDQVIDVVDNRKPERSMPMTVRDFFLGMTPEAKDARRRRGFDEADKTLRNVSDWPKQGAWYDDFKELNEDFLSFLPLPNVFHPDGVLNCIGHTPDNAAQPSRGPRMIASWDTDAATATTKLQTSNTDIASYMMWGGRDPKTDKALRVRWDIFREEDVGKLRDFCYDLLHSAQPKGTSNIKFRELHDDPLLSPTMYLTKKQRAALFKRSGVKPYPIYQYMGDLVIVPAGCPYQVSSWIEHINLEVSFLAGSRVAAAIKTNTAYQHSTRERTLWYHDTIQLETQLFYTWMSCDAFDRAGKVGLKTIKGQLSWPYPKDDKNRPIVPAEEEQRLAELHDREKRGSEISAKIKADAAKKGQGASTSKTAAAAASASTSSAPTAPAPPARPNAAAASGSTAPAGSGAPATTTGGAAQPAA
ncbi:hypothetical protein JCM8208_003304 [Rhodotorula glutinis]